MNDIQTNAKAVYDMIAQGKILEAFDMYYADDLVMQENSEEPRVGKAVNRTYEEAFVNGVTEVHSMKVLNMAFGENVAMIESSMDVTHKEWGRVARSQVAVQTWKDGKIVHERFYYGK